ncbi:hypothetical protein [Tautonia plasticadhaerens]|uniref:Transmembrane protein n=1 Tax=Tautonia plasticadhaerens TaxID=2527974 RepID=A0A518H769_9BACT|nr:hypothetical protein [Tautonia plasticadhaerens]QDV36708.1 hypothetical protein ElP_46370 [Tautonia plasticadhaerens]
MSKAWRLAGGAIVTGTTEALGRMIVAGFVVGAVALASAHVRAQDMGLEGESAEVESEATRRFRELTDPDAKAEREGDALKPPFEFYRTQVAPFDVLTFVKPNHWASLTQELQANLFDYEGRLRTAPVALRDMPRSVVFRRDARLVEGEPMRLSWPAFLPMETKALDIELVRPGALRPDDSTQAPLLPMPAHQMLVVVLSDDPLIYDYWKRYQALVPATTDMADQQLVDRRTYYRLVVPQEANRPNLSSHPLTWTTISHVIWDGFDPNDLDAGQQRAMIDWLHWGGQLVIAGGAGAPLQPLVNVESFLAPYLPAEPSGENLTLGESDLKGLASLYLPPIWKADRLASPSADYSNPMQARRGAINDRLGSRYAPPEPIDLPPDRPMQLTGLSPLADDVQWITDDQGRRFGAERRVGRGRILMLGIDPKESAFQRWAGNDTFIRRVVLRRPEDRWRPLDPNDNFMLSGPELSWYRLLGRDLEPVPPAPIEGVDVAMTTAANPFGPGPVADPMLEQTPEAPVAAWLDSAKLPALARTTLVEASGIEVPGAPFVLRIIVAYVAALVPLNWLVCRFVFRRRELAWVVVPLLAFGFAGAVERAAAIDSGYERACDEIDLLEIQPGYPRGHLSRFSVLYSTGRQNFTISFPGEPSALALPLNANLTIRGEQVTESTWQSTPGPELIDFRVEPRSLAMFRAEQMIDLRGGIALQSPADGPRAIVNQTTLELRDAVLVDVATGGQGGENRYTPIGTIAPGGRVPLPASDASFSEYQPVGSPDRPDWAALDDFLDPLCSYNWGKPEDAGELRLVAWAAGPMPGQELNPGVDRHRGFTLVVTHLRYAPPPPPDLPIYTSVASDAFGAIDPEQDSREPDRP